MRSSSGQRSPVRVLTLLVRDLWNHGGKPSSRMQYRDTDRNAILGTSKGLLSLDGAFDVVYNLQGGWCTHQASPTIHIGILTQDRIGHCHHHASS